jgi:DNA-directed RNA polymerase subunit omega
MSFPGEKGGIVSKTVLVKEGESKFRLISVAAQRAKQLQAGAKPRVEVTSAKPSRIAMQEVMAGTVSWEVLDAAAAAAAAAASIEPTEE